MRGALLVLLCEHVGPTCTLQFVIAKILRFLNALNIRNVKFQSENMQCEIETESNIMYEKLSNYFKKIKNERTYGNRRTRFDFSFCHKENFTDTCM